MQILSKFYHIFPFKCNRKSHGECGKFHFAFLVRIWISSEGSIFPRKTSFILKMATENRKFIYNCIKFNWTEFIWADISKDLCVQFFLRKTAISEDNNLIIFFEKWVNCYRLREAKNVNFSTLGPVQAKLRGSILVASCLLNKILPTPLCTSFSCKPSPSAEEKTHPIIEKERSVEAVLLVWIEFEFV